MSNATTIRSLLVSAASLVLLSFQSQNGGLSPSPATTSAPFGCPVEQARFSPEALASIQGLCIVMCYTSEKTVKLRWVYNHEITGAPRLGYQTVPLEYWPTAATVANQKVYIAGKRVNGQTIVQQWNFDYAGFPNQEPMISKSIVFAAQEDGRDVIRLMFPLLNQGDDVDDLLVQFADSGDLARLSLAGGAVEVLYSAQVYPELLKYAREHIWGAIHSSLGFVYVIQGPTTGSIGPIGLHDYNGDGTLDCIAFYNDHYGLSLTIGQPLVDWNVIRLR